MELRFLLCSVALVSLVAGAPSYSVLPRYSHLHHHLPRVPPVTRPEPSSIDPSIALKDPSIALKDPSIALKDPSIVLKDSSIALKEPSIALKEPSVALKDPSIALKDPSIALEDLSIAPNPATHEKKTPNKNRIRSKYSLSSTKIEQDYSDKDKGNVVDSVPLLSVEASFEAYMKAGEAQTKRKDDPKDIVFQLFTRKNGLNYERLEADKLTTIVRSSFDSSKKTVAIIHGFMEDADLSPWMKAMRDWFLGQEDLNVILVQWAKLASHLLNYYHAAKNARFVGAELGRLFSVMKKEEGLQADSIYLIGFSLGAHAAGVAGQGFPGIGRITGLDPAGPAFENVPVDMRLDKTDAQFVDVIHSNYGPLIELHFGYKENLGHVDHYVNGGRTQPGCGSITSEAIMKFFTGDLRDFHACNHERAYLYYIEALRTSLPPASYECPNYSTFKTGACLRNHTNVLGLQAKANMPGVFYLETQSVTPYLSRHLEVTVTVGSVGRTTTGELDLIAYPLDRVTDLQKVTRSHNFNTGEDLKTMLVLPQHLPLTAVPLQLKFAKNELYFMRSGTLSIDRLQLVDVEQDYRSYQTCGKTLHSRIWATVNPTPLQCGQAAMF